MLGQPAVLLLEDAGVVALHRIAVGVVLPVLLHRVDEEQAQHLDALRAQALLLVQVLLDGAADHLALHGQRVHVAVGLAGPQVVLAAGKAQLHELVALRDADLADAAVAIDRPPGGLLQVVAVLHGDLLALDAACRLHVQLDLGA